MTGSEQRPVTRDGVTREDAALNAFVDRAGSDSFRAVWLVAMKMALAAADAADRAAGFLRVRPADPDLIEQVKAVIEQHQVEYIAPFLSEAACYECGCNEYGTCEYLPDWDAARTHIARAIAAVLEPR